MNPRKKSGAVTGGEFTLAECAAKFISAKTRLRPKIALVLGSGLGAFPDELSDAVRIPYERIPHFPHSTVIGHAGCLVIGKSESVPVAVMRGRVHFYEGYSLKEVIFPMRVFSRLGIRAVILTNAAGGINLNFEQGALVVLRDHINLQGVNPLVGPNDERFGARFPDMTDTYYKEYRSAALEEAKRLGIVAHEGVYAGMAGPSYETPAEIRFLRTIGADVVGMSTVPEVIAARHMGMRVLGISCVTNMAAGIFEGPIHHEDVLEAGERMKGQFMALLRAMLPRIAADLN
ncbi:MAG TPA: purine-nucleoside phosphorylase [Candidatus Acidoferrales bacterium]|nr:purine-nucleoside phosphorylase [Candidatus Acidoferrales bacterium]